MRKGSCGASGGASTSTHHGWPSGRTPSPRSSPPTSIRKWRTPWPSSHSAAWSTPKPRSEEHTSELQSLMRISYAVFCLKKKISLLLLYTILFSYLLSSFSHFYFLISFHY